VVGLVAVALLRIAAFGTEDRAMVIALVGATKTRD
jgi:hypothetical protein